MGFSRPTFDDLLNTQIERAKEIFGEDIDTDETSVFGKFIRLFVADLAEMYETLEGVFYARFPNTAKGVNLDRLCAFVGIERNPATSARYKIVRRMKAETNGMVIPYGFQFSNEAKTVFYNTIDDYVVKKTEDNRGYCVTMYVDCTERGIIGNLPTAEINTVVNPIPALPSLSMLHSEVTQISEGSDEESDYSLRKRFQQAITGLGQSTLESLKGAILQVSGVNGVSIKENVTNSTVEGMPPHSFQCYVLYNDASQKEEIAKAIYYNKPIGIQPYGSEIVSIEDNVGITHSIGFTQTVRKEIYIEASLLTDNDFSDNSITAMKQAIADKINALKNGDDVYISSIYGLLHVEGVASVTSLKLSTDNVTYTAEDVMCSGNEVARILTDNITIVEVK